MRKTFSQLSYEQRLDIKNSLDAGMSKRAIADRIGVHRSTIYNEIDRGTIDGTYNPEYAEERYKHMCSGKGRVPILESEPELAQYISEMILTEHLSPEKIANIIKSEKRCKSISVNTIYRAIDTGLIPCVTREDLRSTSSMIFSGGQIVIPKWAMEQLDLHDGDTLHFEILDEQKIIYKKEN